MVRVVTETLDKKGHVAGSSTTEAKTTLLKVGADGVTLEIQVCVEVAGKRFDTEPQTIRQGFHGKLACQGLKTKDLGAGHVVIDGRKVPCKVLQMECIGPTSKTVTSVYYSAKLAPYILRRQSVTTNLEGKTTRGERDVQVVGLDMPCRVLAEIKSASHVKTVERHPKKTVITRTVTSTEVPGGVISHGSKELDQSGRLVRRSTLELIDYGLEPAPQRTGLFGRPRPTRFRKPARYSP